MATGRPPAPPRPGGAAAPTPPTDPARHHAVLIKTAASNPSLYNQLITLYSKNPATLPDALRLFHRLPFSPTVVSWTGIISAHFNDPAASLHLFLSMLRRPTLPNQRTVASFLKTCATFPSLLLLTPQLHSLSVKLLVSLLPFAGSALVTAYAKSGHAEEALKVFDRIHQKDEVCYSSAIVGLAQNHYPSVALRLFVGMRYSGVGSNMYSVSGALRAAAELAALEQSQAIHAHAVATGLEENLVVGTALIDAYGKSGIVIEARQVFNGLSTVANVITWNTMLAAYAQLGDGDSTVRLFEEMVNHNLQCDKFTFLAVLTMCGNAGLVDQAKHWLELMNIEYGVPPGLEHYTCLIGAMARAGHLEEAMHLSQSMPFEPDDAVWRTLLSASVAHRKADIARVAGQHLLEIDRQDESAYIMLSNVYSATGRKNEAAEVRKAMRGRELKNEGGRSWVEVRGKVHVFMAGDRRHNRRTEIYTKVVELMKEIGKLGYEGWEDSKLWYHSEKLAVAFGLVSGAAPEGKALRVVKNLRICGDCHEAFKYVTRAVGREIVVRDVNRYHRFENGICSCKDIW